MELVNTTRYAADCTLGTDRDGLDHLLAVVKATFRVPAPDRPPEVCDRQRALTRADRFSADPGLSATLEESDYALAKPYCDVLLNGSAYVPGSKPVAELDIGLRVEGLRKALRVSGPRRWVSGYAGGIVPSAPAPFTRAAFGYDTAFGGRDERHPDPREHGVYLDNPVGVGYHRCLDPGLVVGASLPNTEAIGDPVRSPAGGYRPMAFGPVGRGWPRRIRFAGTYDEHWRETKFPFLPDDFDPRYFQSAPPDQWIGHPHGGETVELYRLTEDGYRRFRLPRLGVDQVVFYLQSGEYLIAGFRVDTLHLFPDEGVFTLAARASVPYSGDPLDCAKVIVGRGSRAWVRALEEGKRFVPREARRGRDRSRSGTVGEAAA